MGYEATEKEQTNFRLHSELFRILGQYKSPIGVKLYIIGPSDLERDDFIVQKKICFHKKPILTISPPYTAEDVNVRDHKYHDLGEQIKDEIAKFWNSGVLYHYKREEQEQNDYVAEILMTYALPLHVTNDTKKSIEKVIREVDERRFKKLLESVN